MKNLLSLKEIFMSFELKDCNYEIKVNNSKTFNKDLFLSTDCFIERVSKNEISVKLLIEGQCIKDFGLFELNIEDNINITGIYSKVVNATL